MTGTRRMARFTITPAGRQELTAPKEKAPAAEAASAPGEPQRACEPGAYAAVPVKHDGVGSAAYFSSESVVVDLRVAEHHRRRLWPVTP